MNGSSIDDETYENADEFENDNSNSSVDLKTSNQEDLMTETNNNIDSSPSASDHEMVANGSSTSTTNNNANSEETVNGNGQEMTNEKQQQQQDSAEITDNGDVFKLNKSSSSTFSNDDTGNSYDDLIVEILSIKE